MVCFYCFRNFVSYKLLLERLIILTSDFIIKRFFFYFNLIARRIFSQFVIIKDQNIIRLSINTGRYYRKKSTVFYKLNKKFRTLSSVNEKQLLFFRNSGLSFCIQCIIYVIKIWMYNLLNQSSCGSYFLLHILCTI